MITRQQLQFLRQTYGLSFREVAEASEGKISHTAVAYIEKGERVLNQETGAIILQSLYKANEKQAAKRAEKEHEKHEQ